MSLIRRGKVRQPRTSRQQRAPRGCTRCAPATLSAYICASSHPPSDNEYARSTKRASEHVRTTHRVGYIVSAHLGGRQHPHTLSGCRAWRGGSVPTSLFSNAKEPASMMCMLPSSSIPMLSGLRSVWRIPAMCSFHTCTTSCMEGCKGTLWRVTLARAM